MNAKDTIAIRATFPMGLLPMGTGGRPTYPKDSITRYKEAVNFIKKEKNKELQTKQFGLLVDELFNASKKPGFDGVRFLTHCGSQYSKDHQDWLNKNSADVCSLLRMVKRLHVAIKYKPGCIDQINTLIRQFGGTVMTVQQMREHDKAKLLSAAARIKSGEKMPRKKKKAVKTGVAKLGLTLLTRGKLKAK